MASPYQFTPRARLLDFMRQAGNPSLINLAAGLPSVECVPKAALKRAFDAAFSEEPDVALGYHTPDGDYGLRQQIAARFARRGISVTPEEMVITTGCTQALHGMIRLLAEPGEVVACEAPAYYATLEMLGDSGVRILPLPVRDPRGVDLDLVATLFERFRPKLFVICATLSNPSGATMPNEARCALVDICRKTDTHLLEDDIYGELSEIDGLRPIRSYDDGSIVSYVMSFSKTVAPGIRVGVCAPGRNTERFAQLKCQQDMHSATLCEVAFRKYLEGAHLDSHLLYLKELNRQRRQMAREIIEKYFPEGTSIWIPAGGFLLWVEVPQPIDIEVAYQAALLKNVAFSRGKAFFTTPDAKVSSMRINCSCPTANQLVQGLETLGKILRESL
ncbi:MAG: PLP-dependent aminotransferase family protein [Verrucomicrobia bacterium]|nr:PLP-dependent aminotransferase family protein [Verrucomicrobiota bacterium]MBV9644328.1 PLP-dependent aminotransferase family protein [Verrucomicrobiota bacterium]